MKKIFSFMMALCLVVGVCAAPHHVKKWNKSDLNVTQSSKLIASMPTSLQASSSVKPMADISRLQTICNAPKSTYQGQAKEVTELTLKTDGDGLGYYLGDYLYEDEGEWYGYYWRLIVETNQGPVADMEFVGPSRKRIEGNFRNVYMQIGEDDDAIVTYGKLKIAYDSPGTVSSPTYSFDGTFTDDNGDEYHLSGKFAFPNNSVYNVLYAINCEEYGEDCDKQYIILEDKEVNPTHEILDIKLGGMTSKFYNPKMEGWYLGNDDEQQGYSFNSFIYTKALEDAIYTDPDMFDMSETEFYLYDDDEDLEIKRIDSLKVNEDNKDYTFDFYALGMDGNTYHISFAYSYPVPSGDPIVLNVPEATAQNNIEKSGVLLAVGTDATKKYLVGNGVYTKEPVGTFTEMDQYHGYMVVVKYENKDTLYYNIDHFTATIDTTSNEYGELVFHYDMVYVGVNEDNEDDIKEFKITMTAVAEDPYKYDNESDILPAAITVNYNDIFDASKFDKYGCVYIKYTDKNAQLYGIMFTNELDPNTILPVGEYPINDSEEAPSMLASEGYFDSEGAMPSYYATLISQSGKVYLNDMWFMVSGKATMSEDKLVIMARNSKDKLVKITFKFITTDLPKAVNPAHGILKTIHNGHLVILRNSKPFSVMGQPLK